MFPTLSHFDTCGTTTVHPRHHGSRGGRGSAIAVDLRWRIISDTYNRKLTQRQISDKLQVHTNTVSAYQRLFADTGDVLTLHEVSGERGGGRFPPMPSDHRAALWDFVEEEPYLYLDELRDRLSERGYFARAPGIPWSLSCLCKALRAMGLNTKKMAYESHRVDEAERASFSAAMEHFDADQIVCLDETRRDQKKIRRVNGRAPPGISPVAVTIPGTGPSHSILALCNCEGLLAWHQIETGYDADSFMLAFETRILPFLNSYPSPNSVLLLDNASLHHTRRDELEQMVQEVGARIMWLPPYTPTKNPIEWMFKDLKTWLQRNYGWVCEDIDRGIEAAMIGSVCRRNAAKYYEAAGYVYSANVKAALQPLVQKGQPTYLYN